MRLTLGITLVGLVAAVLAAPVRADHAALHACGKQPAVARFPAGFPVLVDDECGYRIGGFGGVLDDDAEWGVVPVADPARRRPVIFVHGNVVDHADWYPVRDAFIAAGWDPDDLWAPSYNGLGNDSGSAGGTPNPRRDQEHQEEGSDGMARNTNNRSNVADLAAFVDAVLRFTGSGRFSMVSHSLGVTLARRTLEVRPDLARRLVAFVGIAGANHGTSLCPPGSAGEVNSCDELEAGSEWLAARNARRDEFGMASVMTVYDGTGVSDIAYMGPDYASSPVLADVVSRALDCTYPYRGHHDLRLSAGIVEGYRLFVEAADARRAAPMTECPPDPLGLRP